MCKQLVSSSFLKAIKLSENLKKFVSPKCLGYKGTKDSISHVFLSKTSMSIFNMPRDKIDVMLYKTFVSIQHDSASKWFSDFKLGSITSFFDLGGLFVTNYANNKQLKRE